MVNADKIKAAGVDSIVCMSVNDAFVMGAWGEAQNADEILMLADGNGEFTTALGLELDGTGEPERGGHVAAGAVKAGQQQGFTNRPVPRYPKRADGIDSFIGVSGFFT